MAQVSEHNRTAYGVSIRDLSDLPELVVAAVAFAPTLWVLVAIDLALFGVRRGR